MYYVMVSTKGSITIFFVANWENHQHTAYSMLASINPMFYKKYILIPLLLSS